MMTMRAIAVLMTGAAITIPVAVDAQTSTNRVTLPVWAVGITKIDAQRAAERDVVARSYRRGTNFGEYRVVSSQIENCTKRGDGWRCQVSVVADYTYGSSSQR